MYRTFAALIRPALLAALAAMLAAAVPAAHAQAPDGRAIVVIPSAAASP